MSDVPTEIADANPVQLAIAKLDLRPGDVLVLRPGMNVDNDTARRIVDWVKGLLPDGAKFMLVNQSADLTVIRPEGAPPEGGR